MECASRQQVVTAILARADRNVVAIERGECLLHKLGWQCGAIAAKNGDPVEPVRDPVVEAFFEGRAQPGLTLTEYFESGAAKLAHDGRLGRVAADGADDHVSRVSRQQQCVQEEGPRERRSLLE
ncbi:MAG TPA: hypothetical protein VEQ11_09585 [Chloroflexota bacterium]|nr:hypothetical protein [Chloroflexota bacterium]